MTFPRAGPRETVYQNDFHRVYRVPVDYGSYQRDLYVTDYAERAGMVAVRQGMVLLVRQYRLLIEGFSLEIPGGKVDDNELPATAAVRECLEETGVLCQHPRPLLSFHPGLDTLYNPTHLFYSDECECVGSADTSHRDQGMESVWLPLVKCREMIFAGEIVDSLSIIALLTFLDKPDLGVNGPCAGTVS